MASNCQSNESNLPEHAGLPDRSSQVVLDLTDNSVHNCIACHVILVKNDVMYIYDDCGCVGASLCT